MESTGAFVGRAAELALLDARIEAATRGQGGVALIGGEPGIGKTRLADEAAARAPRPGRRDSTSLNSASPCSSRCGSS